MKVKLSAFVTGIVIGVTSALAQAFLGVAPPPAYGVCMVGHPRDLMVWVVNHILGVHFEMQLISWEIPVLTAIGVLIGSVVGAMQHKEFKFVVARDPIKSFIFGFLVINFGLILGACPLRAIVYTAYGNLVMLVGFISIVAGVITGVEYMRRRR